MSYQPKSILRSIESSLTASTSLASSTRSRRRIFGLMVSSVYEWNAVNKRGGVIRHRAVQIVVRFKSLLGFSVADNLSFADPTFDVLVRCWQRCGGEGSHQRKSDNMKDFHFYRWINCEDSIIRGSKCIPHGIRFKLELNTRITSSSTHSTKAPISEFCYQRRGNKDPQLVSMQAVS